MIEEMTHPLMMSASMMAVSRERGAASTMGEDEFRAFYERTARPLWSYLSRITGSREQADDILQEAYFRMFRAETNYESESHRRNSLFRIATNLVRDAARHSRRYPSVAIEDETTHEIPSAATHPDLEVMTRTDLARAMKKLEPVQRQLLWLAYAQGASHVEIAGILGMRPISIRTLLLRARRKLAAIMTEGDAP